MSNKLLITLIIGLSLGIFIGSYATNKIVDPEEGGSLAVKESVEQGDETNTEESIGIKTLEVPIEYFNKEHVAGGESSSHHPFGYTSARFDDGYRSHPELIEELEPHIGHWEGRGDTLPPVQAESEISPENHVMESTIRENMDDYGDWARRFLPSDYVVWVDQFDVTGNGEAEYIIALCGLGGNRCPHETLIVDNNDNILTSFYSGVLQKHPSGNGFMRRWEREYRDPNGYMLTRYVFQDEQFWPLYEQEVLYYRVKDTLLEL